MKNLKILLPTIVIAMLLTTGCQSWNDFWGIGGGEDPNAIAVDGEPNIIDEDVPTGWGPVDGEAPTVDDLIPDLSIKMPKIYFSYDKDTLGTSEQRKLDKVATFLNSNPTLFLIIEGNCDERGSLEYNRTLGEKRALSVKDYLVAAGVAAERLRTISYGEEKPAVGGTGERVFAKNRRAELIAARKKK